MPNDTLSKHLFHCTCSPGLPQSLPIPIHLLGVLQPFSVIYGPCGLELCRLW
jgi:hypothetical protein